MDRAGRHRRGIPCRCGHAAAGGHRAHRLLAGIALRRQATRGGKKGGAGGRHLRRLRRGRWLREKRLSEARRERTAHRWHARHGRWRIHLHHRRSKSRRSKSRCSHGRRRREGLRRGGSGSRLTPRHGGCRWCRGQSWRCRGHRSRRCRKHRRCKRRSGGRRWSHRRCHRLSASRAGTADTGHLRGHGQCRAAGTALELEDVSGVHDKYGSR